MTDILSKNNKNLTRSDFELMAPVGSFESLHAAVEAGADAVYFGVGNLNMRAKSSVNFTFDDLAQIVAFCKEHDVNTYLTVNTIVYDDDLDAIQAELDAALKAEVTAVIASDIAAIEYAKSIGLEVHISTQCNISNTEAVKFYARYADTVVLARELNLSQVSRIHEAIESTPILGPGGKPVKIEMFCHGALCMAVSGKCYLSLHQMNTSANRGSCTQICRRGYEVTDLETGDQLKVDNKYIMSPKDLKTIHFLNKLIDAGVRVFKIEGRARGPEYVKYTVKAYSEALRAICDGNYNEESIAGWDNDLRKVFNRDFWNGYYLGQRLGEWSAKYGSSATHVKKYAAKGVKYFSKLGVGEFLMEAGELKVGDEVLIIGPTTGLCQLTIEDIQVGCKSVDKAVKGDSFSIAVPGKIRPSDKLYIWEKVK